MHKTIATLIAALACAIASWTNSTEQKQRVSYENNGCVICHSGISNPAEMATAYLEWHFSAHGDAGVTCDKCHGGEPTARDAKIAHRGVLATTDTRSRLNQTNLPETCGSCHKEIVSSFVQSTHFQKLKQSGLGPSCNSCHAHMATAVARFPTEGAAYCAYCHNTINGLQPPRPDIPDKAKKTLEAIGRADYTANLIDDLLRDARQRKLSIVREEQDAQELTLLLHQARTEWHTFTIERSLAGANKAFELGMNIRDRLHQRINVK
jgi:hypothetical protein